MCVIAFRWEPGTALPLILIANRDEVHARPTDVAHRWAEGPIGGRDRQAGGSWLAVGEAGRLAAVTNVREVPPRPAAKSRGALVSDFLTEDVTADDMAHRLDEYGACNLMLIADGEAWALGNRTDANIRRLAPGIHAVSNGPFGPSWPKARQLHDALLPEPEAGPPGSGRLFAVLADRTPPPDADLPDTGIGIERERALGAPFILGAEYGTRASTIVTVDAKGRGRFLERSFAANGEVTGDVALDFRWPAHSVGG